MLGAAKNSMGQQASLALPIASTQKYGCVPLTEEEEWSWVSKVTNPDEIDSRLPTDAIQGLTQQEVGKEMRGILLEATRFSLCNLTRFYLMKHFQQYGHNRKICYP